MSIVIAAFYKFVGIADGADLRARWLAAMQADDIKGTILVAPEGNNGTISGAATVMAAFLADMRADPRFAYLQTKEARAPAHPFQRSRVKLKREIITMRRPEADPSAGSGIRVPPNGWNALIADPDITLIDTRNAFEVAAGTFRSARNPQLKKFSQWPDYADQHLDPARHRKIAMFCTGGIRCEKASAYLLQHGFETVYQLDGGILRYFAEVPPEQSLWQGECAVFDERGTVAPGLQPDARAPKDSVDS